MADPTGYSQHRPETPRAPNQELELFRQLWANGNFEKWLLIQQKSYVFTLAEATDPVAIHRAQGAHRFILKQLELLEKAKDLR